MDNARKGIPFQIITIVCAQSAEVFNRKSVRSQQPSLGASLFFVA